MKTKFAAWLVSNCGALSGRDEFVKKMKAQGIQIDVTESDFINIYLISFSSFPILLVFFIISSENHFRRNKCELTGILWFGSVSGKIGFIF